MQNISGSIYLFQECYISFESSRHGEFFGKNGDYVLCTLTAAGETLSEVQMRANKDLEPVVRSPFSLNDG